MSDLNRRERTPALVDLRGQWHLLVAPGEKPCPKGMAGALGGCAITPTSSADSACFLTITKASEVSISESKANNDNKPARM